MKRYYQLDGLRGLFLIIMVLDHFEGPFRKMLYEKVGFFTGAEGFILISGIVAGYVYSKYKTNLELFNKSKQRLLKIYRYHIISAIILIGVMSFIDKYSYFWFESVSLYVQKGFLGFFLTSILLYQPNPIDILPLYFFLVLMMPFMIALLKGRHFIIYFGVTFLLWTGSQIFTYAFNFSSIFELIDFGFFNYMSWQLLFFIGVFLGFSKNEDQFYGLRITKLRLFLVGIICFSFFILKISIIVFEDPLGLRDNLILYRIIFNKSTLGIGRIINFLFFSYLFYAALIMFKGFMVYKPLLKLGQNSILVFTIHTISYILFYPFYEIIHSRGFVFEILFSITMVLVLFAFPLFKINTFKRIFGLQST